MSRRFRAIECPWESWRHRYEVEELFGDTWLHISWHSTARAAKAAALSRANGPIIIFEAGV